MLNGNLTALEPRSQSLAPPSSNSGDECQFRPEAYVADGIHVQRERVLAGEYKSFSLPLLVVAAHDGPAVTVTKPHGGGMHSRVFVTGDVEIYPAGFHAGSFTRDRASDQICLGLEPDVIANAAEAAAIDSHGVEFAEHFGSQDPIAHHAARRLLREQQTPGLGGRLYTQALVTELVIHLLREYSSLRVRENGDRHSLERGKLRPALEMIHDDLQANLSLSALADAVQLALTTSVACSSGSPDNRRTNTYCDSVSNSRGNS